MNQMNATEGKYVIIYGWMREIDLTLTETMAYALVYGYAKNGEPFQGSITYMQQWLRCTRHTAIKAMQTLEDKGLLRKEQVMVKGSPNNRYYITEVSTSAKNAPVGSAEIALEVVQPLHQGSAKNALGVVQKMHYNKDIIKENIIKEVVVEENACAKIFEMLTDNEAGLEIMLLRNGLISAKTSLQEMKEIVKPYAEEYYKQQLMSGGEHFDRRGRSDVKTHFMRWLPKHLEIKKDQEEIRTQPITTKQNGTNQQDLIAELRKRRRAKESGQ